MKFTINFLGFLYFLFIGAAIGIVVAPLGALLGWF